jgi:uncharacterized membrane protein
VDHRERIAFGGTCSLERRVDSRSSLLALTNSQAGTHQPTLLIFGAVLKSGSTALLRKETAVIMGSSTTASSSGGGALEHRIAVLRRLVVSGLLGTLVSMYLLHTHYAEEPSFCDFGAVVNCSTLNQSAYSELFNVPVAAFGAVFNLALVLVAAYGARVSVLASTPPVQVSAIVWFVYAWAVSGVLSVVYFVVAEVLLGAVCPLCTVVHLLALFNMWCARTLVAGQVVVPPAAVLWYQLRAVLLSVGVALLVTLVLFNTAVEPVASQHGAADDDGGSLLSGGGALAIDYNRMAPCLAALDLHMFGLMQCSHCVQQKRKLGEQLLASVTYHECATRTCLMQNEIRGYPTWVLRPGAEDEERRVGLQSLRELADWVGCGAELSADRASALQLSEATGSQ